MRNRSAIVGRRILPRTSSKLALAVFVASLGSSALAADRPSGSIVGWGDNAYDQTNVPQPNTDFIAVAGGGFHSLGLKGDGSIVAWGCGSPFDYYGECDVPSPNIEFVAIAPGFWHNLGLKADGSIVAWGKNNYGQTEVPSPNTGFVAVAAGGNHSLGLKADGSIVAWGYNDYGQTNVPSPNTGFVAVAAGDLHTLGLKADGSIVAWGYNGTGQTNVPQPNTGFVAIGARGVHSLALKSDGSVVAWGYNRSGRTNVPSPNTGFVAVAAGGEHSLGLKADGSIVAWGRDNFSQTNFPSPNTGFVAVAAGANHSLAIRAVVSGLSIAPQQRVVSQSAGLTTFAVSNTGGGTMNWDATVLDGVDWLRIRLGGSGVSAGTVHLWHDKNPTADSRMGKVRISAPTAVPPFVDVTVVQSGRGKLTFIPPIEPWKRSGYKFGDDWELCMTKAWCDSDPAAPRWFRHVGIDIKGNPGDSVRASAAGTVKLAQIGSNSGIGGFVIVEHDLDGDERTTSDRVTTLYLHVVPKPGITPSTTVVAGQEIATIQAITSGPHLHFGYRSAPYSDRDPNASLWGALPPEGTTGCTCCKCKDSKRPLPAFHEHWIDPESIVGPAEPP